MNWLRRTLLYSYFQLTQPWRRARLQKLSEQGRAPIVILYYHRVANTHPNDWTISCDDFQAQMEWLQAHVDLISLGEAQQRMVEQRNRRIAVSITFDDGYAENCDFALPYLLQQNIPCTYFVSLQHVANDLPFPHDVALGQPLTPNTMEELRGFSSAGIEIGAHTRTHADLGRASHKQLMDEVVTATRELEVGVDQTIRYFAFPYGLHRNLNPIAFHMARRAGLQGVCSAYGGYNFPGDDPFHLQRFHGDPETLRIKNWVTLDPRKMKVHRYPINFQHPVDLRPAAFDPTVNRQSTADQR